MDSSCLKLLTRDGCCQDKARKNGVFRELEDERHHFSVTNNAAVVSGCPGLTPPPDVALGDPFKASNDSPYLKATVDAVRTRAEANNNVVGLDIEREISATGTPVYPPATIQLAAGKVVVIFYVLHGQRAVPGELPDELVGLLEDDKLTKTGVWIEGDYTKIANSYGVDVARVVDLRSLAEERKVEVGLRREVADLCDQFLRMSLLEGSSVRICRYFLLEHG